MKCNPEISVLVPCNSEKYLYQSLMSIENQSLDKRRFQVILVLDRITKEQISVFLQDITFRIKIDYSKDEGIVAALNHGLELIDTKYTARFDQDDVMHPHRLMKQLEFMENNSEVVALGSQLRLIDENGKRIGRAGYLDKVRNYSELFASSPIAHPASFVRTSAVKRISGYRSHLPEDWDLWVRLYDYGELRNLSEYLLEYRIHNNQLSRDKFYFQSHARNLLLNSFVEKSQAKECFFHNHFQHSNKFNPTDSEEEEIKREGCTDYSQVMNFFKLIDDPRDFMFLSQLGVNECVALASRFFSLKARLAQSLFLAQARDLKYKLSVKNLR